MSKTIKSHNLLSPPELQFSFSRRWLLRILGLVMAGPASKASGSYFPDNPDKFLQDLEQKILSVYAIVDHLIIRQGLAERALWKTPTDLRRQKELDSIDSELVKTHENLALLIVKLNETSATTLVGLQVKARLIAYDDEIVESLCENILALRGFNDQTKIG